MSRSPSPAEKQLLAEVKERGATVSSRQLERWRQHGLVPGPDRTWLGRGHGSASEYDPSAVDAVVAAADAVDRCSRLDDALLILFIDGHPVDADAVRQAYRNYYQDMQEGIVEGAEDGDTEFDVANAAAPRLVRRILRDPRGRAMRRRLRGYEDPAESVLTSVITGLLHVLQAGEFLGDDSREEFARAGGLDALWTVEIGDIGTLADSGHVEEAVDRTAAAMRLNAMTDVVADVCLDDLRDTASEFGILVCAMKDLALLAFTEGVADSEPWPADALSTDDPLAVAQFAPAWLQLRAQLPKRAGERIALVLEQHDSLHVAAKQARETPERHR